MLMAVLLSLLVSAVLLGAPPPPGPMGDALRLSPAYHAPLVFAVINWGQAVISVFVLHWAGQILGGRGELADMLAVMVWLQFVSLLLAAALFVVGLLLPLLGAVMSLAAIGWGIWATIALVDAANRFDNMARAAGVCIVALLAFTLGMMLFSAVLGGLTM